MNLNAYVLIGIALILFGTFQQLATIIYTTEPSVYVSPVSPAGTQTDPSPLVPGLTINIVASVRTTSTESPSCQVTISGEGFSTTTLTLQIYDHFTVGDYTYYTMKYLDWEVPDLENGTVMTFYFKASAKALYENQTYYGEAYSYGVITHVDGAFYINGELATETSRHVIYDPTITIEFRATKQGDAITRVYLHVYDALGNQLDTLVLTEDEEDVHWEANYTLPSKGQYEITGFFNVGDKTYRKMSVLIGYGEGEENGEEGGDEIIRYITVEKLYGVPISFIVIAVGATIFVYGATRVKSREG